MTDIIKLERVELTANNLNVYSAHTTYLQETLPEKVDIKALLARFKTACAEAKVKGIKIHHKYKTRKFVADNAAQYEQDYAQYLAAFNATAALAKVIFVDKDLPVGTSDNEELKTMYVHRNAMAPFWYTSALFNKVYEFARRVTDFEQKVAQIENGEGHEFYF